jgi:ribA/ribD-fused uncharacterized protein
MSDEMHRDALVARIAVRERIKFLFFWGHTQSVPGVVDKACLSQWYGASFTEEEHRFATSEHYMMFCKAMLFADTEAAARVLDAKSPAQAKAIGREVRGYTDARWHAERFRCITRGNVLKFGQNPAMLGFLTSTGTRVLVEASPRDRIWGIGMGKDNEHAENPRLWRGLNLLGFALMAAREQLRMSSPP